MIIKTRILASSVVIFLSSILLIGIISSSSYAYAQEQPPQQSSQQFPESIIAASDTDTLKATQQREEGEKVSGFKIDLSNVITAQVNSQVRVFVTDSPLQS